MMKKWMAALLIAALLLAGTALAASYNKHDIAFTYDDAAFDIDMDDHTDDEDLVILAGKDAAWGEVSIRIHLRDLDDGEAAPTINDFAEIEAALDTKVEQMEAWLDFRDVFTYETNADGVTERVFVAPVYDDDDREVEDLLTVNVSVTQLDDEDVAMGRDDAISAVLDTLKINED